MKKLKNSIYTIFVHKRYIFFLIGLVLVTMFATGAHKFSYNSDDVAQQTVITKWVDNGTTKDTYFTPDPWTLKWPAYYLRQVMIPENSRKTVLIESWMQNVGLLICFFYSYRYFSNLWLKNKGLLKSKKALIVGWLPFIWFFTLGESLASAFLKMPNTRNFEIGLLLLLFAVFHWMFMQIKSGRGVGRKFTAVTIAWVAVSSVLFFSDPYCLIFLGVMVGLYGLFTVVFEKTKPRNVMIPFVCMIAAVVVSLIIEMIASKIFGIHLAEAPGGLDSATDLGRSLSLTVTGLLFVNGISFHDLRIMNIAIAGSIVFGIGYVLFKKTLPSTMQITLLLTMAAVAAAAIVSGNMIDSSSGRYLVLAVPLSVLLSSSILINNYSCLTATLYKNIYTYGLVCLALAITVNFYGMIVSAYRTIDHEIKPKITNLIVPLPGTGIEGQDQEYNDQSGSYNILDYRLIDFLKSKGLTKGYANYWRAHILTYLSNDDIDMSAIVCEGDDRKIEPYRWISTSKELVPTNVEKSFILYDDAYLNYMSSCDRKPLGEPLERYNVTSRIVIEVYAGDVAKTFDAYE